MASCYWTNWDELDQLVRQLCKLHPPLLQRLADAPPRIMHGYAIYLRSTPLGKRSLATSHSILKSERTTFARWLRSGPAAPELTILARMLCTTHVDTLLEVALGDMPPALLAALDRCGDRVRDTGYYASVIAMLRNPALAPFLLSRRGDITTDQLAEAQKVAELDPLLHDAFLRQVISHLQAMALDRLIATVRLHHGHDHDYAFTDLLDACQSPLGPDHLWKLVDRLPAAPVPWPGDDLLAPITCPVSLSQTGLTYRNCLAQYRLELVLGTMAFYRMLTTPIRAIVGLRREPTSGWIVFDIKGPLNIELDEETRADIFGRFAAVGIGSGLPIAQACAILRGDRYYPGFPDGLM